MTPDTKLRDELAGEYSLKTQAHPAFKQYIESTFEVPLKVSFKEGWDAKAKHEDEKVRRLVDRMRELGQAMPPNAVSMEIQKALKEFEK